MQLLLHAYSHFPVLWLFDAYPDDNGYYTLPQTR